MQDQQTGSGVIPVAACVGIGMRLFRVEERVVVRCPCCGKVDVDTRHARISRAGAQVNQHQWLIHAIDRTLNRLGIPHQMGSSKLLTADTNLRMDIVIRRRSLRDASIRAYRGNSILLDVTEPDPPTKV